MKQLTVNQIMLLLDVYRGGNTQGSSATLKDDLKVLTKNGLIENNLLLEHTAEITTKGNVVVKQIKRSFIY